jgi:hypothetical protein
MKPKICIIGGCKDEGLLLLSDGCVFYGEFGDVDDERSDEDTVYSIPLEGILTFPNGTFFDGTVELDDVGNVVPAIGEFFNDKGDTIFAIGDPSEVDLVAEEPPEGEVWH